MVYQVIERIFIMEKKVISIERSNCDPQTKMPIISSYAVEYYPLRPDEIVIVFEEDSEWEGKIIYQANREERYQWCVDINYDSMCDVNEERMIGREEGASASIPLGEKRGELTVAEKMFLDGFTVEVVSKYVRISKEQLEYMKDKISRER